MHDLTPSQTAGPFLHIGLIWPGGEYAVPAGTEGAFWLRGTVIDGKGDPVGDALIESWQIEPDAFGRTPTAEDGGYAIHTVRPATGFINLSILARGLLDRLVTRAYFAEPGDFPDLDGPRRQTLMATPEVDGYRFDIRLQGERETVFFDV